ncbi:RNA polymerase sigma factor [Aquimarina sp. W85]|uniref:RNA polymerase sigma factor n=1 Tax=Aquimarina rhodophyticola TaxID=3342246 RepID=UPI0036715AEF
MILTKENTETLIAKCRCHDRNAQLEIYNRYYKAMYNTTYRIIKDPTEAEDIMQEAFLTAFTKLSSLEKNSMFGAWLKRIVINASLTALKKNNKYEEVALDVVDYKLSDETYESSEKEVCCHKIDIVLETLKQLKTNYSTILSLYLIEGYDYEEIAEIMNISNSNCRTLVSRAKQSLKKKLLLTQ